MALELSSFSGSGMILTNTSAAPRHRSPRFSTSRRPPVVQPRARAAAARLRDGAFSRTPTGTATSTFVGPRRRTDTARRLAAGAICARRRGRRRQKSGRAPARRRPAAVVAPRACRCRSDRARAFGAETPRPHIPPLWRVSEDSAVHGGGDAGTSTASRIEGEMASRVTARWPKASLCVPSRGEHTGRSTSATARSVSTRAHDTERAAPKPFERVARHDVGLIGATSPMEREVSEALMEIQRMRNRGYR